MNFKMTTKSKKLRTEQGFESHLNRHPEQILHNIFDNFLDDNDTDPFTGTSS